MTQGGAIAPSLFARGSGDLLCGVYSSEGEEEDRSLWKRKKRKNCWSTSNNSRTKC